VLCCAERPQNRGFHHLPLLLHSGWHTRGQ